MRRYSVAAFRPVAGTDEVQDFAAFAAGDDDFESPAAIRIASAKPPRAGGPPGKP